MAKTDRDTNYMREAFGTTSLITDYVNAEVELSPVAESLLRVAKQSYSSGSAAIVTAVLRELAKHGHFIVEDTESLAAIPLVALPADPLLKFAQELEGAE
jgi:hypothetical protein